VAENMAIPHSYFNAQRFIWMIELAVDIDRRL